MEFDPRYNDYDIDEETRVFVKNLENQLELEYQDEDDEEEI